MLYRLSGYIMELKKMDAVFKAIINETEKLGQEYD
jgi:hypothetical protein